MSVLCIPYSGKLSRSQAEAQFFGHLIKDAVRHFYANKQQDDDDGRGQAEAQFLKAIKRLAKNYVQSKYGIWANMQQSEDVADAQLWGTLGKLALRYIAPAVAPRAINYIKDKLG